MCLHDIRRQNELKNPTQKQQKTSVVEGLDMFCHKSLNPNVQTCLSVFWTASSEQQINVSPAADENVEYQTSMQADERTLQEQ